MSNQRYGRSFVQELIDDGETEQALEEADKAVSERPEQALAHFDRASALEALERGADAIPAYEKALACNDNERTVEGFVLDDAYFSALVEAAQLLGSKPDAIALVSRYRTHAPSGAHLGEVAEWEARFAGRAPSLLDKTKD